MSRYDDIADLTRASSSAALRTLMQEQELSLLTTKYPQLPADYVDYLRHVGWGGISDGAYMIYQGPMSAADIYDAETAKGLSHVLFFGDDCSGYCAGFDTRRAYAVVEIEPTDMSSLETGRSFEGFIKEIFRRQVGD